MIQEPMPRKAKYTSPKSWQPWYISISDWLMRNPAGDIVSCARALGRHHMTVRYIMNSDMFREFHAQRRREWRENHDFALISRVTDVATKSLDLILEKMDKQADKIPMQLVTDIATSSLDRLGYGPKQAPQPAVQVNVSQSAQVIAAPVTAAALEEARDALRAAERKKIIDVKASEASFFEARPDAALQSGPGSDSEVVSDLMIEDS